MGDDQQQQQEGRPGPSSSNVEARPSSSPRVTVTPDAADGTTNLQPHPQDFESYVQNFVNGDAASALSSSFVVRNPSDPTTTMAASATTPTTFDRAAATSEAATTQRRRQQEPSEPPGQPEHQMSIPSRQEQPLSQPAHHTRDQTGCTTISALTDLDDLEIEGEVYDDDNDATPYPSTPANGQSVERRSNQSISVIDTENRYSNVRARNSAHGPSNALSPVIELSSPSTVDPAWSYHLDDVLKSTREGPDESAVMKTVDKTTKHVSKRSLLPDVSDTFIFNQFDHLHQHDGNDHEDSMLHQHHSNHNRHLRHHKNYPSLRSHDGLLDVTRKLQKAPMWRTSSDGTTPGGRTNNEDHDDDKNISSSLRLSKKLENYCENAARVLPSRRTIVSPRQALSSEELHHDHSDHTDNSNGHTKQKNSSSKDDVENQTEPHTENVQSQSSPKERRLGFRSIIRFGRRAKTDVDFFVDFIEPYKKSGSQILLRVILYVILPCLTIAAILFYLGDNPPTGTALYSCTRSEASNARFPFNPTVTTNATNTTNTTDDSGTDSIEGEELCIDEEKSLAKASISWWMIFASRQVITLCTSFLLQVIIIDFLTLRTRFFPSLVGTHASLAIAASKGWPFIVFMWTILDFILLFGNNRVSRHWLYWQKYINLFNAANPSGNATDNWFYKNTLYLGVGISIAATIKRAAMANVVGKRVVESYRTQLTRVIKQNVLLGEIASLSARGGGTHRETVMRKFDNVKNMYVQRLNTVHDEDNDTAASPADAFLGAQDPTAGTDSHMNNRSSSKAMSSIFHEGIGEFLDEWEDPVLQESDQNAPTMTDVLLFRRALDFVDNEYPFSSVFGKADSREHCIESAQNVFDKLRTGRRQVVDFSALKQVAVTEDGIDKEKLRQLVRIFRPNRIGEISKLDFVKSCDKVYKSFRLLLANINNSSQIDRAYERIINIFFYMVCFFTALGVLGVDLNNLFLLLSSLLVSCAFMIQSASSKYVEGVLLVLSRKPFDVGDRIAIMEPNAAVNNNGPPSGGWVVEKVDLFTTQVRLGTTREYCTFANGSLANSRILNMNRSENPNVFHYLKFAINVTQDQLDAFKNAVTEYVKNRPRSWTKIVSMRCDSVAVEQSYIQYLLIIQHREKWQAYGQICSDRGQIFIFCLHLMKKLGMHYTAPKMPIELVPGQQSSHPDGSAVADDDAVQRIVETYGQNGIDPNPEEEKNKDV